MKTEIPCSKCLVVSACKNTHLNTRYNFCLSEAADKCEGLKKWYIDNEVYKYSQSIEHILHTYHKIKVCCRCEIKV